MAEQAGRAVTESIFRRENPLVALRGVHLDLKGLPPTPNRLLQLLDLFAAARFNVVLVEWEDSFPWECDRRFRSETAYSPSDVDRFHRRARDVGLQVIPLVQSLGHMETPLRFDEYAALREIPDQCEGVNPLAPGAVDLVRRMVDDVLSRSGAITHFHLGGDEHFSFGQHPDTKAFVDKHGKAALYLRHIEPLCDHLLSRGIRPILWHDMMHDWDEASLARLREKADLMVWSYRGHPDSATGAAFNTRVMERFQAARLTLWGAGAFKGADSAGDGDLPVVAARVENALAWAQLAQGLGLKGLVATGWSRYTTHRVQCEPIEAALDVLVQHGVIFHDGAAAPDAQVQLLLDSLGETERFHHCRAAIGKFAVCCARSWEFVRLSRQQRALEADEPRRRGSGVRRELERLLQEQIDRANAAADEVRRVLDPLVTATSIESYLRERLHPLRVELSQ